jgi:hypothetical protein
VHQIGEVRAVRRRCGVLCSGICGIIHGALDCGCTHSAVGLVRCWRGCKYEIGQAKLQSGQFTQAQLCDLRICE